jgi:hypothetical protein
MLLTCDNVHDMGMIQVRNVPDDLHRQLKVRAAESGMTLSDYVLRELREYAVKPTLEEWLGELDREEPVTQGRSAADAIRAERRRPRR